MLQIEFVIIFLRWKLADSFYFCVNDNIKFSKNPARFDVSAYSAKLPERSLKMLLKTANGLLVFVIGFIAVLTSPAAVSADPPNLIIILTDDQGYADVGFNGSTEIPTPNIDRIANNGVRFTRGYVTHAVCAPSRAGLITGRYQDRFGASRNPLFAPKDSTMGLPLSEQTLADALRQAGYTSSIIGKWHLGAHKSLYPLQRGFDEFYGFLSGGHHYFPDMWNISDKTEASAQWDGYRTRIMRNNGRVNEEEYLTDALSREAVDFVRRHADNTPFFLFLSYNAPHTPLQATEEYLSRFEHIEDERRRTYAAMISAVDDGVGALLDTLDELDLQENTMIYFLSDNGGPTYDNTADNTPLRGTKGTFYEGGVRVPFAMQWPAAVPEGIDFHHPISSLDIFATITDFAGIEPKNELDGVNLVPYLTGEKDGYPHEALLWRNYDRDWVAMVMGDGKYLNLTDSTIELYNLADDIGETRNIPIDEFEDFEKMVDLANQWLSTHQEPAFLGLLQNDRYNRLNPDRFNMVSPFEPDTSPPSVPEGYELVWSDEFNIDGPPDEAKWSFEKGFTRNYELQWYQPENAYVKDGRLIIKAKRESFLNPDYDPQSDNWRLNREDVHYTSASLRGEGKFSFKYGIMEVRARIDTTMGSWPAIWTLGDEGRWPERGEIDIMEFYRYQDEPTILANAAWAGENDGRVIWDSAKIPLKEFQQSVPDWAERFHIWRMDWDEDYIKIYLNGELLNKIDVEESTRSDGYNPFRQPHFILLNLAIGSNGGNPEFSEFPITYEVDYVRVFQKKTQ